MKGDRVHRVSLTLPNVTAAISTGTPASVYVIDLVRILSDELGRNLPKCAVYDVARINIELNPQGVADEDQGMVLVGNLAWYPPTAKAVQALKWAASEFKRQRAADYAVQAGLQFYPKLGPFAAPVDEAVYSRRDIDPGAGLLYALTGATDATYYGILSDWVLQHPSRPAAPQRTDAQLQTTRLYDEPIPTALRGKANIQVGYGISVAERFANNATGPEDAATPFLTVAAEDPAVWVWHSRSPAGFWPWTLDAAPGRSYPMLLGEMVLAWEQSWPIRKTGMWGGNEIATPRVDIEILGWHELQ